MGKRLIGKGMAIHPQVKDVLQKGTLVVIAGTTNGYVAEEILGSLGQVICIIPAGQQGNQWY